jgi:type VI protein secretion system component VasK
MRDSAASATATTKQLSQTFPPEPEGHIDQRSEELLLQPIKNLEGLIGGDLRSGGAAFCTAFTALTNKFPFNPTATPEVTLPELADILQPNTGRLWTFYNNTVKSAMNCQNGQCTPTGNPPLNPAFVRFFSQLMQFSRAIYGEAGNEPNYRYTLRPQASERVELFTVTVNGEAAQLKGGQQKAYVWPGTGNRSFKLSLKQPGSASALDVQDWQGLWAVFRFFADADRSTQGTTASFEWVLRQGRAGQVVMINGKPFTYDFQVETTGPSVFSKEFLSTLKCVGPLAK